MEKHAQTLQNLNLYVNYLACALTAALLLG